MAPMTVRGICYQFFIRGVIPDMSPNETKNVSRLLVTARELGMIRWRDIVDETRRVERESSWDDPDDFLATVAEGYRKDRWQDQSRRLLMISEKATIGGVLRPTLQEHGVGFLVVHGWSSATAVYDLALLSRSDSRPLELVYVGDHDPSGRYMSDVDIPRRLREYGGEAELTRLALTPQMIVEYDLVPFPVYEKRSDTRFGWFLTTHGTVCAELDGLDPNVLRDLVEQHIVSRIDQESWQRADTNETAELESLGDFLATWEDLKKKEKEEKKDEREDEETQDDEPVI